MPEMPAQGKVWPVAREEEVLGALMKRPHLERPSNISTPTERQPHATSFGSLCPLWHIVSRQNVLGFYVQTQGDNSTNHFSWIVTKRPLCDIFPACFMTSLFPYCDILSHTLNINVDFPHKNYDIPSHRDF